MYWRYSGVSVYMTLYIPVFVLKFPKFPQNVYIPGHQDFKLRTGKLLSYDLEKVLKKHTPAPEPENSLLSKVDESPKPVSSLTLFLGSIASSKYNISWRPQKTYIYRGISEILENFRDANIYRYIHIPRHHCKGKQGNYQIFTILQN